MGDSLNPSQNSRRMVQFSGLFLPLSLYSYHVRELLVCWLFFSVLFVCLALLILIGELGVYAGECVTLWARTATRITPVLVPAPAKVPLKNMPRATKFN